MEEIAKQISRKDAKAQTGRRCAIPSRDIMGDSPVKDRGSGEQRSVAGG